MQYYREMINNNEKWILAGIYADEGVSGTSMRNRTGFLQMIEDCQAGKIDLMDNWDNWGRSFFVMILLYYGVDTVFSLGMVGKDEWIHLHQAITDEVFEISGQISLTDEEIRRRIMVILTGANRMRLARW